MQVVVARYNEDIQWTRNIKHPVVVYNKGVPFGIPNEILLLNVGREGHTFYHHIVENYDQLADHTAFLQGNPFDHCRNTINQLHPKHFELLADRTLTCSLSGCYHHPGLPLRQMYTYLFGKERNESFVFGAGGQFIASKELIRKRPKEFYEKVVALLEKEVNPIEGFVIERFHSLIMNETI